MRALLVVNPRATATTRRGRDVLARALGSDLKVDVAETVRRGHGVDLGRRAVIEAVDVVVTLGGDGTVNEVVNGLLVDGPRPGLPALAVVPGGSTNVFTRALGLPRDPVEATGELLDALRAGRTRRIGVGQAGDRYFTFNAGLGIDAQAVRAVERRRRRGRQSTPAGYIAAAVSQYFRGTDRRHPPLTLEIPGAAPVPRLHLGIVTNTSPWTYLGERPVSVTPGVGFDSGLGVFAMRRFGLLATLRASAGMLSVRRPGPRGRAVVLHEDVTEFRLHSERPLAFQVDGDYLGEREDVTFRYRPGALRVVV